MDWVKKLKISSCDILSHNSDFISHNSKFTSHKSDFLKLLKKKLFQTDSIIHKIGCLLKAI